MKCDFDGWATRCGIRCADNRVIAPNAFADNDGDTVPLVWNHDHNNPENVLGHAVLENRDEGVYAYCFLNDTDNGELAKKLLRHGDIKSLSIWANDLAQKGKNVVHGIIREVSVVLAGANPGATISNIMCHSADGDSFELDDEAIIYFDSEIHMEHSDGAKDKEEPQNEPSKEAPTKTDTKTIQDVLDTFTKDQLTVMYYLLNEAMSNDKTENASSEKGEDDSMKHNVFDTNGSAGNNISAMVDMEEIKSAISDMKRYGSLKESMLAHGIDFSSGDENGILSHSIDNIDYMFPDDQLALPGVQYIARDMGWVDQVLAKVHKSPFARVKSLFANITEDEARAKGYIKGKLKKEQVFSLLKRSTAPTTIYKKQRIDRDDLLDITDFDVVVDIKKEMRMMINEELARAILIGDQRLASSDDKINEANIRPVWTDEELFTVKARFTTTADDMERAKNFIKTVKKNRKLYKGTGSPSLYAGEDIITDCLLLEDNNGRVIYDTIEKLATALRVKEIVSVPPMDGLQRTDTSDGKTYDLLGIIVNLADYNVGTNRGGQISFFDDFDIDYNANKYLIETRCSGALVRPYSAIAVESVSNS